MEIFLDGKRIYKLGTVGQSEATTTLYLATGDPLGVTFDDKAYHVLAIRYAAFNELVMNEMNPLRTYIFGSGIADFMMLHNNIFYLLQLDLMTRLIPAAILGILALLHFIIFIRYHQDKNSLIASIVMMIMCIGLAVRTYILVNTFMRGAEWILVDKIGQIIGIVGLACSLVLVYGLCYRHFGKREYKVLGVIALLVVLYCSGMLLSWNPLLVEAIGGIYFALTFGQSLIALRAAMASNKKNIWIVSLGMNLMLAISVFVQIDRAHFLLLPKLITFYGSQYELAMSFAMLTFPFSVTVYMALEIARQNIELDATVRARTQSLEDSNASLSAANEEVQRQMVIQSEQSREIEEKNTELHESLETLRRTQNQLAQAEKMASLGTLVAGVAHELNTPIGVAVTAASTLQSRTSAFVQRFTEGGLKKSELEAFVETAQTGADLTLRNLERAANLIQSFKQVAVDQTSDTKRRFKLRHYLEGVITSLEPKWKTTRHRVEIACDEALELETYPGAIAQIITNLIDNSLLHGFQGYTEEGIMRIVVEHQAPSNQALSNQVTITYSDNGRGIPSEVLPRIFDPFFTTKQAQGGTGLGMHIVFNLVTQKLGGEIRCESSENQGGALFSLTFPVQGL
jgi:signal transduction histidine kinase